MASSVITGVTRRRVVVTGLGIVSPLGVGVKTAWERLLAGQSGVVSLADENTPAHLRGQFDKLPVRVAGVVPRGPLAESGYQPDEWFTSKELRQMDGFTQYALVASQQALQDAGWDSGLSQIQKDRTGVCMSSAMGGFRGISDAALHYEKRGHRAISPLDIPRTLINMAAGHICMRHGFRGPNHAVATACASSAHSVGDASRFIQYGDADVMVAGGTDEVLHPLNVASFARARALTTKFNDRPSEASRPFDRDRSGFVMAEGAGVLILEELEHARARGARIYAELTGYGLSADAHRMTAPPPDGAGAALAMRRALGYAQVSPDQVGYVNAHATSTPLGDACEHRAIRSVLLDGQSMQQQRESGRRPLAVSSVKGAFGHTLGASGAVEALVTVLALHHNMLPPTVNLQNPSSITSRANHSSEGDEEEVMEPFDLDYVPGKGRQPAIPLEHALSNSYGFAGTNAALCLSKWRE